MSKIKNIPPPMPIELCVEVWTKLHESRQGGLYAMSKHTKMTQEDELYEVLTKRLIMAGKIAAITEEQMP